jgi:hypothetical protein
MVSGGNATELRVRSTDLQHSDGQTIIQRGDVEIPKGLALTNQEPLDVLVTVKNVSRSGRYEGELEFVTVPKTAKPVVIKMQLEIAGRPDVKPVVPNEGFQVVHCGMDWFCTTTDSLLPKGMVGNHRDVQFHNQGLDVADVEQPKSDLVMRGEKSGSTVSVNEVQPQWLAQLAAGKISSIQLKIQRDRLLADRYQGTLRLKLKNADEPVTASLTLEVRNGMMLASLVILLGIIFGRWVHKTQPPPSPNQRVPARGTLAFLAGTRITAEEPKPVVKPLAFLGLLVLLTLIGMKTLYIDIATFGAQGMFDYLGLFLWGLSSDIAQRTLQNLPR